MQIAIKFASPFPYTHSYYIQDLFQRSAQLEVSLFFIGKTENLTVSNYSDLVNECLIQGLWSREQHYVIELDYDAIITQQRY